MPARAKKPEPQPEQEVSGALQVTAPLVQVATKDGKSLHLYRGDIVPSSVTDQSVDNLKALGFVSESSDN